MDGKECTPKYLYHYTSIHSLAYILQTQKIRFTRLSDLNDPLEGGAHDLDGSEYLMFCSSWTAHDKDVIPLWKMYTDLQGVRIKLPSNMFDISSDIKRGSWGKSEINYADLTTDITATSVGRLGEHRIVNKIRQILGPDPIQYVKSNEDVFVEVTSKAVSPIELTGTTNLVNLSDVGLYKCSDWEYEKEWRFRLPFAIHFGAPQGMSAEDFCNVVRFENSYVDVPLNLDVLNGMEVMLGPLSQHSHEIIVQSLLDKYTTSSTLVRSKIMMR